MRSDRKGYPALLMTAVLAVAISGCGGGSSTTIEADTGMTGSPDTGMTGGTDTGMAGGDQVLTVPDSMGRSETAPVHATNADTFGSAGLETRFPAVSAVLERNFGTSTVALEDNPLDTQVDLAIADDNDAVEGDEEIVVTYVFDDGEELAVTFTPADYVQGEHYWTKDVDGETHQFWFRGRFRHFTAAATHGCDETCYWVDHTFGARTPARRHAFGYRDLPRTRSR